MAKYWTCPYCDSNLDLWEKCDCQEQLIISNKAHKRMKKTMTVFMEGEFSNERND